ncbi:TMEM175 family protein [Elizabethkingia ursingii]
MKTSRLEAFSDGVIAIIITIMVLELKVPDTTNWSALYSLLPKFICYILSFIYIGIYWNNHHHMLHYCTNVNGKIMWSNLFFLFWLSLMPFATAWMGEHHFDKNTTITYGILLILVATGYTVLSYQILNQEGKDSPYAKAIGSSYKEKASIILYILGIASSFYQSYLALFFYYAVAIIWIIPDRRLEKNVNHKDL